MTHAAQRAVVRELLQPGWHAAREIVEDGQRDRLRFAGTIVVRDCLNEVVPKKPRLPRQDEHVVRPRLRDLVRMFDRDARPREEVSILVRAARNRE